MKTIKQILMLLLNVTSSVQQDIFCWCTTQLKNIRESLIRKSAILKTFKKLINVFSIQIKYDSYRELLSKRGFLTQFYNCIINSQNNNYTTENFEKSMVKVRSYYGTNDKVFSNESSKLVKF